MPSASDEARAAWGDPEDGVGENKACRFLEAAGWRLGRDWHWRHPAGRAPSDMEADAMAFLVDEWDYGWWTNQPEPLMGRVLTDWWHIALYRLQVGDLPWVDPTKPLPDLGPGVKVWQEGDTIFAYAEKLPEF